MSVCMGDRHVWVIGRFCHGRPCVGSRPALPACVGFAQGSAGAAGIKMLETSSAASCLRARIPVAEMETHQPEPLASQQLARKCHLSALSFKTTDELDDLDPMVAQKRAAAAIQFGAEVAATGFNLVVIGASRNSMDAAVKALVEARANRRLRPEAWRQACCHSNWRDCRSVGTLFAVMLGKTDLRTGLERLPVLVGCLLSAEKNSRPSRVAMKPKPSSGDRRATVPCSLSGCGLMRCPLILRECPPACAARRRSCRGWRHRHLHGRG